jgi:type IV pilus assembly protein PilC
METKSRKVAKVYLWLTFIFLSIDVFLIVKVVPTFANVFASFGARLPWNVAFVVGLGNWAKWLNLNNNIALVFLLAALLLLTIFIKRSNLIEPKKAEWVYFFSFISLVLFLGFIVVSMFMPIWGPGNVDN